ncbi:MAG: NlpC/P60 family protein [Armatimonadota bacterium]|nr:NlpC/P60 family protein [bacterium]
MTGKRLSSILSAIIIVSCTAAVSVEAAAHKVKQGDTLWALAKKYHTTPRQIAHANGIGENATLALNKTLKIPSKYSAPRQKTVAKAASGYFVHAKTDNVCLRKGPGTHFAKTAMLTSGISGKVLATKGAWVKIALSDGTCGYAYRPLMAKGTGSVTCATAKKICPTQVACASTNNDLIQTALGCRGSRYRRGGTGRGGFDCSGFTRYVFAKYGVSLPHSSAAQARLGTAVSRSSLKSGDLVFFQTYRRGISHVGIYVGDGRFVHAATYGRGVRVDSLNSGYYSSRYRCARRVK